MQNVQIVTDSCAHFANPHFVQQNPVTVIPNKIVLGGRTYREGVDLSAEDAFRLLPHQPQVPVVHSPSELDFVEVFTRLARASSVIISIHPSREMYPSWHRARAAAQQVAGHKIAVIDSRTLGAGQGMLVRAAVKAAAECDSLDEIERVIRGAAERIYSVYYVESTTYLQHNRLMSTSHALLSNMLGVKPFLAMEEGRLRPMEKVRTRVQAIERLVEFAVEFTEMEDALILQPKTHISETTRMLQDRLAIEFPGRHFPFSSYGPSLAALIGTDAAGLVIMDSELDRDDDDF